MRSLLFLLVLGIAAVSCAAKQHIAETSAIKAFKNRALLDKDPKKYAEATYDGFKKLCKILLIDTKSQMYDQFVVTFKDLLKRTWDAFKSAEEAAAGHNMKIVTKECGLYQKFSENPAQTASNL